MTETIEDNNTLLEVKDLTTYFYTEEGTVKAVDGVSFSIGRDEIMGLVGETGCGKSVTALSILKLIRYPGKIVKGSITFEGVDLAELTKDEIRYYRGNEITMIFQDPTNSLNPVFTAGYQIEEVYMLHQKEDILQEIEERNKEILERKIRIKEIKTELKTATEEQKIELTQEFEHLKSNRLHKFKPSDIAEERATEILKLAGIADSKAILKRYPHELSGGMKQRVMIAMGLACNSKLLICDEPTTALDVTIQAQILELIRDLKRKLHNSILFITHDLGVIYELCDKVAVMYAGKIAEYGSVDDIFNNPQHPYSVGLLHAIPRVNLDAREQRLAVIPGMVPNLIFDLPGCRFHPRCAHAMKICQIQRPELIEGQNGVKVACFLYDEKTKSESPELFEKLTKAQKERFDL
jgi:oligopeptide/dipeptide ABC transporter ATP-binding protein